MMAKKRCAQNGIVFQGKTSNGDGDIEILNFSQKHKYDIIIIGSRGLGLCQKDIFWKYFTCGGSQIEDAGHDIIK